MGVIGGGKVTNKRDWVRITKEEWNELAIGVEGMYKTWRHVVSIVEPPVLLIGEDTGQVSYTDERWFLRMDMDYMDADGGFPKDPGKKYYKYYKNEKEA